MFCLLLTETLNYNKDSWLITCQEELTSIRVNFYGRQFNLFFIFCVWTHFSLQNNWFTARFNLLNWIFFFLKKTKNGFFWNQPAYLLRVRPNCLK